MIYRHVFYLVRSLLLRFVDFFPAQKSSPNDSSCPQTSPEAMRTSHATGGKKAAGLGFRRRGGLGHGPGLPAEKLVVSWVCLPEVTRSVESNRRGVKRMNRNHRQVRFIERICSAGGPAWPGRMPPGDGWSPPPAPVGGSGCPLAGRTGADRAGPQRAQGGSQRPAMTPLRPPLVGGAKGRRGMDSRGVWAPEKILRSQKQN